MAALRSPEIRRLCSPLSTALLRLANPATSSSLSRGISTAAGDDVDSGDPSGRTAYEVLGVAEDCSFADIKSSFHRLAKATHPDVSAAGDPKRFLQILAAYEILSDSNRRAHYDIHLLSLRRVVQRYPRGASSGFRYSSSNAVAEQSNVVEWLKWYRLTVDDIVANNRVVAGSSYLDRLESELYSALRAAYYGPEIESFDLLPDRFEAEERSFCETPELLHLVSGRDLFGLVRIVEDAAELPPYDTLSSDSHGSSGHSENHPKSIDLTKSNCSSSDNYKDLELHICGKAVAVASRSRNCNCVDSSSSAPEDHIHVFLVPTEQERNASGRKGGFLGTVVGLGSSGEEGMCSVHDTRGVKTHVITKHRTLMVKHLHWYRLGGDVSICECRCSRARLPPSRYWLFEPRCYMHDTGGWYIETFGRDKKGRTAPAQRHWDGFNEHSELRLHPAMYLLPLAYRSLDIEDAKQRWSLWNLLKLKL